MTQTDTIILDTTTAKYQTAKVSIDPLTESVAVRIRRPTTKDPTPQWDKTSTIKVAITLELDGVKYVATGSATGGIRLDSQDQEIQFYLLTYSPPWGFFNGDTLKRLGETGGTYQGLIEIERVNGTMATTIDVTTVSAAAPNIDLHHSVAFDAASTVREDSGDGILSLTHTAAGANRLAIMAVSLNKNFSSSAGTMTYGGSSSTLITAEDGFFAQQSAYFFIAPPASGQTVLSTLTEVAPTTNNLCVITVTGADQTTPVPGADVKINEATGGSSPDSLTVTNVGGSDMVVDSFYVFGLSTATVGANQTSRVTSGNPGNPDFQGVSTQAGSDGGVMDWSWTGSTNFTHIAFRIAAAAATGHGPLLGFKRNSLIV